MKLPYIQFYVSDFLSDHRLSICCAATRGVWMDFLCVMHMNDRCGVITGTREQLARLGRCSTVEVSTAIDELKHTDSADVTERNGIVTVVCRRMKRESDARKQALERVRKYRLTHECNAEGNANVPSGSISGSLEGESEGKPAEAPELIYKAYPRRVSKPDAIRAIVKAVKKVGFSELLAKTRAYAAVVEGANPQFIPHPATWFNGERFTDDPATWAIDNGPKQTARPEPKLPEFRAPRRQE